MNSLRMHDRGLMSVIGIFCLGAAMSAATLTVPVLAQSERHLASSGDAYLMEQRGAGTTVWRFGTGSVEKRVQFAQGHLTLVSFVDRATHHDYVREPSDVFTLCWNDTLLTGQSARWTIDGVTTQRQRHGTLVVRFALHTQNVAIVKSYLLYPQESIIQEWVTVTNRSQNAAHLVDPTSLDLRFASKEIPATDVLSMHGFRALGPAVDLQFVTKPAAAVHRDTIEATGSDVKWAPIQIYHNRETQTGLFIGWDYGGTWQSTLQPSEDALHVDWIARYDGILAPGESLETPKALTGVFHGDLDAMGHELLDYQYRYKWDYTRAAYFPALTLEPTWAGSSWQGGFDPITIYRQAFHMVDLMRDIGADLYWRDNGWWDNEGDWNGPDFGETGRYLAQQGMRQEIYMPIFDASAQSRVAREHPDWLEGILNHARPVVQQWERTTLEAKRQQWGNFLWRKDWYEVTGPMNEQIAQDHGFRSMLQRLLDRNPGMGYNGQVDYGYDFLGLATSWCITDVGSAQTPWPYYMSYILPNDKLENGPDDWNPDTYPPGGWHGQLTHRFAMQGETDDPVKRTGLRELYDLYHYLAHEKVAGRWVWFYHPAVVGDSARWYLERLSRDHRKGILIPGHGVATSVTLYPKGLRATAQYLVSYQIMGGMTTRSGLDLMTHGIVLPRVAEGELIYLNLPWHPGNTADHVAPTTPGYVTQAVATHMDQTGVELRWTPGHDDHWISSYEVSRDGVLLGTVAKGTYYFDHTLGADLAAHYTVVTLDGSGNRSGAASAAVAHTPPLRVLDDADSALIYRGAGWTHQTAQWIAAHGTQSWTQTVGDTVHATVTGRRITVYGRFGPSYGSATILLDGHVDRLVDTYDAGNVPNIVIYDRVFPAVETHTLAIAIPPNADSTKRRFVLDGIQVDATPVHVLTAGVGKGIIYGGLGWLHDAGRSSTATSDQAPATMSAQPSSVSSLAGDWATVSFTGRGITWVGRRCDNCGMADVYVDGRLETTVDTYVRPVHTDPATAVVQGNVPVFTRTWTRSGRHTVKIVIRADANVLAQGHTVTITAMQVLPP